MFSYIGTLYRPVLIWSRAQKLQPWHPRIRKSQRRLLFLFAGVETWATKKCNLQTRRGNLLNKEVSIWLLSSRSLCLNRSTWVHLSNRNGRTHPRRSSQKSHMGLLVLIQMATEHNQAVVYL